MKKIRSVLIAGITVAPNNMTRFAEECGLKWEHIVWKDHKPGINPNHDAVIIVTNSISHELFHAAKDVYKVQGKPVYQTDNNVSGLKQEGFEEEIFGAGVLERLRGETSTGTKVTSFVGNPPTSVRLLWIVQRYLNDDEIFRKKEFVNMCLSILQYDTEKVATITAAIEKLVEWNVLESVRYGEYRYLGLGKEHEKLLKDWDLPLWSEIGIEPKVDKKPEVLIRRVEEKPREDVRLVYSTESPEQNFPKAIPPVQPPVNAAALHDELKPMMDLLLETTASMQTQLINFQEQVKTIVGDIVRDIVRDIVQQEIKALSSKLDMNSTLQSLDENERSKIQGIIELIMRK